MFLKNRNEAKTKKKILDLNRELDQSYQSLGKSYYESSKEQIDHEPELLKNKLLEIQMLKSKVEDLEKQLCESNGMRKCPNCGKYVELHTNFCVYCGFKFSSNNEEKVTRKRSCPNCGEIVDATASFCTSCGSAIGSIARIPLEEPEVLENSNRTIKEEHIAKIMEEPVVPFTPTLENNQNTSDFLIENVMMNEKKDAAMCPHCGTPIRLGASFCTNCGRKIK